MTTTMPADPLSLQVLNRCVDVLKSITQGSTYFYTVGDNVMLGFRHYKEVPSFPYDMVCLEKDDRDPELLPDQWVRRYLVVSIKAYVDYEDSDPVKKLIKHLADVQLAINNDTKNPTSGSLGNLCAYCQIQGVETDSGLLMLEGVAYFDLKVLAVIHGQFGQL